MAGRRSLYTIGHSIHEFTYFLGLLRQTGITAIADVRSVPFSPRNPHFNRPALEAQLPTLGIAYVYLGAELGARPTEQDYYDETGSVVYAKLAEADFFREGLDRVERGLERYTIALMCAEEDPLGCHRGLLIAPALVQRGIRPDHVRGQGQIETQTDFETRLMQETGVGDNWATGLFADQLSATERAELVQAAYAQRTTRKRARKPPTMK